MTFPTFSILITTKNRLTDLKETLNHIASFIDSEDVECIICDDGSTDGTYGYLEKHFPNIQLIKHETSRGLIASRNELLHTTKAKYAITLDDDAHIVSENTLHIIETFFESHKACAVIAFRIFWGKALPNNLNHTLENTQVKGFVGCGHVWRMDAWRSIPNYPEWFVFYGEEEFAAFQLFKTNWEVWFVPDILLYHRVDLKSRKKDVDYQIRLIRSLRSGWYLYFLFYPWSLIPKRFLYTIWIQFKNKVFKGDFKVFVALLVAMLNVLLSLPRLISNRSSLTKKELYNFQKLPNAVIYWEAYK